MAVTEETLKRAAELKAAVDVLLAQLTRKLTKGWADAWDRLEAAFALAVAELIAANDGRWPSRRQVNESKRLSDALKAAADEHQVLVDLLRVAGTAAAAKAASLAGKGQAGLISSQLPTGHGRAFVKFSDEALAVIVRRTGQQITSLSRPLSAEATAAMKAELIRGIETGEHPDTVARAMVRRVEGQFAGGLTRALVISRTELQDAYRSAAMASQLANRDVLRGWVWLSELSRQSCSGCWVMHGTEHPLDEPGPDDHPNGRCSRAPITRSWKDLGFDIPEPPPTILDARATFDALSQSDRLAIMGPGRLDLLDRGQVNWSDLATRRDNPGWRSSYNTTPLRDLVRS